MNVKPGAAAPVPARRGGRAHKVGVRRVPMFSVHVPRECAAMLSAVLESGYIGQGPRVEEFERRLQALLSAPHVLTVNSCTSALQLALRLAGVGRDDEVITSPMTCAATNLPILALGARPVWADVDPTTGLIDPASVERLLTGGAKALIVVDLGGNPCLLGELRELSIRTGLVTIQDAAQALGAVYRGSPVATWADFTCFSFQAIKHLTTGDGGALVCRRPEDHERGMRLRWYGIERDGAGGYWERDIEDWGWKFHMNDIAASLGLSQLPYVDRLLRRRAQNAAYYDTHLSRYFARSVEKPRQEAEGSRSANWLYTILLRGPDVRSDFVRHMAARGVEVSTVHGRNDVLSVFRSARAVALPGVDAYSSRQVSLPVHPALSSEDRHHVVKTANDFASAASAARR